MRVFIRTRTRIRMRTDVNASCIQSRLWTHTPTRARAYTQMRILMDVLPEADLSSARKRMFMINFARCYMYIHAFVYACMHCHVRAAKIWIDNIMLHPLQFKSHHHPYPSRFPCSCSGAGGHFLLIRLLQNWRFGPLFVPVLTITHKGHPSLP